MTIEVGVVMLPVILVSTWALGYLIGRHVEARAICRFINTLGTKPSQSAGTHEKRPQQQSVQEIWDAIRYAMGDDYR